MKTQSRVGVVAIGRNEGDRLKRCIQSALQQQIPVVYVDSGSTDGSVDYARSQGVTVVELDLSQPFTAARARNAGADRLVQTFPDLQFVQFVDGDCELISDWFDAALAQFDQNSDVVVVCGRLLERYPDRTIYNRLCDMEWNAPTGEISECGGIAMIKLAAFQKVGGFNPTIIAGEEPELCVRLRRSGGKIFRIAQEMAWHDAQMERFGQWWKRSYRAGHAYAEGAWMHGNSPERHWVKQSRSSWLWGFSFPIVALLLIPPTLGLSLLGLLTIYLFQTYRVAAYMGDRGFTRPDSWLYAGFCTLSKFPQAQGQLQFHWLRLQGKRQAIVEYKTSPVS
jgi:GT2 family glycosyltransferase